MQIKTARAAILAESRKPLVIDDTPLSPMTDTFSPYLSTSTGYVVQAIALGGEGIHGRLFIGRFHQFPERIARAPALQERDANALVGIVKNLFVPIRLQHAGEALHGTRNRSHDEADVVERAFWLPG